MTLRAPRVGGARPRLTRTILGVTVNRRTERYGRLAVWMALAFLVQRAWALDPHKSLTQYSRHVWGQQDGLPQDTVRSITQTPDGYLWLGTDEGLARFDGFEFTVFTKSNGDLPANSITALAASPDGALWVGTSNGLAEYRGKQFRTYTVRNGLPDNDITGLYSDHAGTLWIVAGIYLSRFQDGKFTTFPPGADLPVASVRAVREDRLHDLIVAGVTRIVRLSGGKPTTLVDSVRLGEEVILCLLVDRHDNLWIAGSKGLIERMPSGQMRRFDTRAGLPDVPVRSVVEDRDGNIWAGTNGGIARLEGGRFVVPATGAESDLVRVLFEDREGDLWVGGNNGLTRLRDDAFTAYGKTEGLPSDEPNAVFQDHLGRVWVGFQDAGLMLFSGGGRRLFTARDGMPETEIYSIREGLGGDLLIGTREGLVRMHGETFTTYIPPDPQGRRVVFDARSRHPQPSRGILQGTAVDGDSGRSGGDERQKRADRGGRRAADCQRRGYALPGTRRRAVGRKLR